MSTVLAIFRRDGEAVDPEEMDAMLGSLQHRITDGQDIYRQGCVILAHQHLWITPEEQGERQPLIADSGRFAISFDGRLDNRQELLDLLGLKGIEAADISDARLVLHAYAAWEEHCVSRLLGDFAFVLWDAEEQRLLIARDPLGVRQVTYYCDGCRCIVASTTAPILAHPTVTHQVNNSKIAEFIVQYEWNQEESFFRHIYFCPPAHYLLISASTVKKQRYWLPDLERRTEYQTAVEYVDEFRVLFREAVNARLRFKGKLGIALSSGMDSSSITGVVHQELEQLGQIPAGGLSTYTLSYPDVPDSNEEPLVRKFARHYELDCKFIRADNIPLFTQRPLPCMVPDYLFYIMTDPSSCRLYKQMQKDGVRIGLHGAYGDTVFEKQKLWAQDVVRDRYSGRVSETLTKRDRIRAEYQLVKRDLKAGVRPAVRWLRRQHSRNGYVNNSEIAADMGIQTELANETALSDRLLGHPLQEYWLQQTDLAIATAIHWNYYVHSSSRLRQGMLDLGIDGWDPFRDRRLVEYVLTIPAYLAGRPGPGDNKWILREAMRGILPEETRTQSRHSGPKAWANAWFASSGIQELAALIRNGLVVQYGYYNPAWIERRLDLQRRAPKRDYDLWRCACLEVWLRSYGSAVGSRADSTTPIIAVPADPGMT